MKKTRLMVLTLAVAIMMMGAGYAYWQDEVDIGSTVSTGELDVTLSGASINNKTDEVKAIVDSENNDNKNLNFEIKNLYPGASANYSFNLKNTGTITAKIDEMKIKITNPNLPAEDEIEYVRALKNNLSVTCKVFVPALTRPYKTITATSLDEFENKLNEELKGEIVEVNKNINLEFEIGLNSGLTNNQFENTALKATLSAVIKQVNDN